MNIIVGEDDLTYDSGDHPEVTIIVYSRRRDLSTFLAGRFPNLTVLELRCHEQFDQTNGLCLCHEKVKEIYLHADSSGLQSLRIKASRLERLLAFSLDLKILDLSECPSLDRLILNIDSIENLHSLEYCTELRIILWTALLRNPLHTERAFTRFRRMVEKLRFHLPKVGLVKNEDDML